MSCIPVLETERLVLRGQTEGDFDAMAAFYQTDRSRYAGGPLSRQAVWRGFASSVGQWLLLGYGTFAIDVKDGAVNIGEVGLNRPVEFPENELGWVLFDGHEGRGYATEAAGAARAYAYDALGWNTLVSYIDPDNSRSIALAERLGARRDPAAATPNGEACLVYRHPAPMALRRNMA